ncbi:MAG: carboxypeptidase-like regulatory domain-containing protein, partial [Flavobacteriales bacterium]|nr:carboxypeptidase-like regulatory domain-containing protein [Flavobacteriales bacterium]
MALLISCGADSSDNDWKDIRPVDLEVTDADIYTMHEDLSKDKKFVRYKKLGRMLSSGWLNYGVIDYGPYYNVIGYNSVEGLRLQMGARTFFSRDDRWRLGGYTAYGFADNDFKFGLGFSYLLAHNHRWIVSLGIKDDLEQRGVLLSQENDVYGRNFAASLFTIGDNSKLTNTVSYKVGLEMEAAKNFRVKVSAKYDYMTSIAGFDMGYLDPITGVEQNSLNDFQVQLALIYTPNRKEIGHGVDRDFITNWHPTFRLKYIRGVAGFIDSRFNYDKIKFYYRQPFLTGFFGKTIFITEFGKTFGTVPLQLMDIIPGNQTITIEQNMFSL